MSENKLIEPLATVGQFQKVSQLYHLIYEEKAQCRINIRRSICFYNLKFGEKYKTYRLKFTMIWAWQCIPLIQADL